MPTAVPTAGAAATGTGPVADPSVVGEPVAGERAGAEQAAAERGAGAPGAPGAAASGVAVAAAPTAGTAEAPAAEVVAAERGRAAEVRPEPPSPATRWGRGVPECAAAAEPVREAETAAAGRAGEGSRAGRFPCARAVAGGCRSGPAGERSPRAAQRRFGSPRARPRLRANTGTACRIRTHESGKCRRPPVWGLNGQAGVRRPPPSEAGSSAPRGPSPCSEARTRRMVPCHPRQSSGVGTLPCRPPRKGAPSRR